MTIAPHAATKGLAQAIQAALPSAEVTLDAARVAPAVLAGQVAICVSAPRISADAASITCTWTLAVVAGPVADLETAATNLDTALTALGTMPGYTVEDADPITWSGTQTAAAPAYLTTISAAYARH